MTYILPIYYIYLLSSLNWIDRVNRMDSERTLSQNLIIIPKEVDQEDDKKDDGGTVYKEILGDAKLKTGKRG